MWVEAQSGARPPEERSVAGALIGDVVGLRDAGRSDRRAAGAVALVAALGRRAPRAAARRLVRRVLDLLIGAGPALVELDARGGVAVRLVRGALPTPAGADRVSLPARLGERVLPLVEAAGMVANPLLQIAHGDAVDHGLDAGHPAREYDGALRLFLVVHPARQLDRFFADAADVDGTLTENRIVAERFE